jgi:hypothetical protein
MPEENKRAIAISPYLVIAAVWLIASLATLTLFLEYPSELFGIHLRTYPGMFLWPLVFLPVVGLFLLAPLRTIWRFVEAHFARPKLAKALFVVPVLLFVTGMTTYEWFNGKLAVWEVAPAASSQRPADLSARAREWGSPAALEIASFDDWALSIRSRADPRLYLSECRFGGQDLERYREQRCHCSPLRRPSTGAECDGVRQTWYSAMAGVVAQPALRSYTYYMYRISFTAMAMVFIVALLCVVYMECFSSEMRAAAPRDYEVAKTNMHVVALLMALWWVQYLYFGTEQFLIFPFHDDTVFRTFVISLLIGAPIVMGTIYAFGQRVRVVRSFMENLFIPLLGLLSALIGMAAPEMVARASRVMFGVEASVASLAAFITISLGICLFPLFHFVRDGGFAAFRAAAGRSDARESG